MISKLVGGACLLAVFTCVAGVSYADPTPNPSPLVPGETLDKSNWQKAEGLLPPEILKHYREGGYINKIVDWPIGAYKTPTDFAAGTKSNEGRFEIGNLGQIIEKSTGKQQEYIIGFPFPTIDPNDPKAASKILWNFFYRTWYFGSSINESQVNWISATKLQRRTDVQVELSLLRRRAHRRTGTESAELQRPVPHRGQVACRRERHGVADLALPRPGQTRLHLGVRAGAAARARREPGQSLGRVSRLRHERGRRAVLRRQARGLHLDAEGRDGAAAPRGPAQPGRKVRRRLARQGGLARQLAGPAVHRIHERQVDGRCLGAGDGCIGETPPLGDRGDAEGPSTICTASSTSTSTRSPSKGPGCESSAGRGSF